MHCSNALGCAASLGESDVELVLRTEFLRLHLYARPYVDRSFKFRFFSIKDLLHFLVQWPRLWKVKTDLSRAKSNAEPTESTPSVRQLQPIHSQLFQTLSVFNLHLIVNPIVLVIVVLWTKQIVYGAVKTTAIYYCAQLPRLSGKECFRLVKVFSLNDILILTQYFQSKSDSRFEIKYEQSKYTPSIMVWSRKKTLRKKNGIP